MDAGLTGSAELHVTAADTAVALGSGDVEVLATPRALALAEAATVAAVQASLPAEQTTVGVRVELDHLRPTAVGGHVRADAELVAVDGRRLTFAVRVVEGEHDVARGTVVRTVVDRARFGP